MRGNIVMMLGRRLICILAALAMAGAVSACGGTGSVQAGPGLNCANYALHGAGRYHNEESVQVTVSNPAGHAAAYAVDVTLTGSATASSTLVTIDGSVPSHSSGQLSRKVLTAGPVQRCQVTRITAAGGS
jgi:hypothetical protein